MSRLASVIPALDAPVTTEPALPGMISVDLFDAPLVAVRLTGRRSDRLHLRG